MIQLTDEEIEKRLRNLDTLDVREAMEIRCNVEGHSFTGYATMFQVYMACRWCGERQ